MDSIYTFNSLTNSKYEKMMVHSDLYFIRHKDGGFIIGYINRHKEDGYWFWFMGVTISDEKFITSDDAIRDLLEKFTVAQYNKIAKKANTYNNENYTKK